MNREAKGWIKATIRNNAIIQATISIEPYLTLVNNLWERSLLTRFRLGSIRIQLFFHWNNKINRLYMIISLR